MTAAVVVEY